MIIIDTRNGDMKESDWEGFFGGKAYTQFILEGEYPGEKIQIMLVKFEPGARNKFHTHSSGQVLYVTEGEGIVATREKEVTVTPGTMVYFSPGEEHWHGATDDSAFAHFSIMGQPSENIITS
jgi:quercetin dioxygenase-like cupin family protein